ncbi:MAG: flagellar hook assembly protein FlgD [Roseinatronobacter sp.]
MDIARIASAADTPNGASVAKGKLDADYQSFLKLLIAQVSNQDPLEPMDSTTFVSQLAQLTQVEQSIVTNTNLEKINQRMANVEALSDVQLIGRDVTIATDRIELRDGRAALSYSLAREAETVTVTIKSIDGTVIRELTGQPRASKVSHDLVWDGRDVDGLPVPDGQFQVTVTATDATGNAVAYQTESSSRVEELTFRDGYPLLILRNGAEAFAGSVTSVR